MIATLSMTVANSKFCFQLSFFASSESLRLSTVSEVRTAMVVSPTM